MMTDAPTGHFQSIVLQPHAGQFVIDELGLTKKPPSSFSSI